MTSCNYYIYEYVHIFYHHWAYTCPPPHCLTSGPYTYIYRTHGYYTGYQVKGDSVSLFRHGIDQREYSKLELRNCVFHKENSILKILIYSFNLFECLSYILSPTFRQCKATLWRCKLWGDIWNLFQDYCFVAFSISSWGYNFDVILCIYIFKKIGTV